MIYADEALQILLKSLPENTATETVPLDSAQGRILAEEIQAPFPLPRFTNSAMDGYAVRAVDIQSAAQQSPVSLTITEEIPAGRFPTRTVTPGTTSRIMTGAPLPDGADTVVPVELTDGYHSVGETVQIFNALAAGANVRRAGEEIETGALLLSRGIRLGPGEIGVLASFGRERVTVARLPRVVLAVTGNELQAPGGALNRAQIYNANLPLLRGFLEELKITPIRAEVIPDDPGTLRDFLESAVTEVDLIITTGGVSLGTRDYLRSTWEDLGYETLFWRVRQKPGKPLFCGRAGDTILLGLPGNPVSAAINFLRYAEAALAKLQGASLPAPVEAELAAPFPCEPKKQRYLFGFAWYDQGTLRVLPTRRTGSHMLTSVLNANCWLEAPPRPEPLPTGAGIKLQWLPGRQPAPQPGEYH